MQFKARLKQGEKVIAEEIQGEMWQGKRGLEGHLFTIGAAPPHPGQQYILDTGAGAEQRILVGSIAYPGGMFTFVGVADDVADDARSSCGRGSEVTPG